MLEIGDPPHSSATLARDNVYVKDVDAVYRRAIEFGAVSISPPEDKPYQERAAGVKDSFGNIWWIAAFKVCAVDSCKRVAQ
ncbi:MAG: hypothetical protein L0Y50_10950 [Beijerinckiaceae bacterium]|nr:hypothetical protein [Beijerinckiaceae bacterium]MCI0736767.1 hypothetical protein [Beijerinckiaceae bacterium]